MVGSRKPTPDQADLADQADQADQADWADLEPIKAVKSYTLFKEWGGALSTLFCDSMAPVILIIFMLPIPP